VNFQQVDIPVPLETQMEAQIRSGMLPPLLTVPSRAPGASQLAWELLGILPFFRHSQHLQTSWMFGRSEHLRTLSALEQSSMKFDDLLGISIVFEADESRCT